MIDTSDILEHCFMKLCMNQLQEMHKRYRGNAGLSFLTGHAMSQVLDFLPGLHNTDAPPGFQQTEYSSAHRGPSDEAVLDLLPALKTTLSASEFLFMKAIFSEDEDDRAFLLAQAQMLEPENLRFHLMGMFHDADLIEDPPLFLEQLLSLPLYTRTREIEYHIRILQVLNLIQQEGAEINLKEAIAFFSDKSVSEFIRVALLYRLSELIDPKLSLTILDGLGTIRRKYQWTIDLIRANSLYHLNDFQNALSLFQGIDRTNICHPEAESILRYRTAVALKETGNSGRAIMMLMDLVNESDGSLFWDGALMAAAVLARYYLDIGDISGADRMLRKIPQGMEDHMQTLVGKEYGEILSDRAKYE